MKKNTLFLVLLSITVTCLKARSQDRHPVIMHYQMAQPRVTPGDATPVTWVYSADKIGTKEAMLVITGKIKSGWHVYSQKVNKGGPVKTTITFQPSKAYTAMGTTTESKPIISQDKTFNMNVSYFEKEVVFSQKISLKSAKATAVTGKLTYMTCNDMKCLPPEDVDFTIPLGK